MSEPDRSTAPAIRVRDLSKAYPAAVRPISLLGAALRGETTTDEIPVLRGVSFDIERGECVGLIGENGAGKSTLLRLVAGALLPSAGSVAVRGQLRAVLDLGVGFDERRSGRENARLGGLCQGLRPREIDERMDWIVDFAGLEQSIDHPFRTYSSGMRARLMYAVAFCLPSEIMLVDEALSTGDGAFVRRCIAHMRGLCADGTTALVASHDVSLLESLCDRVLALEGGELVADGVPGLVCGRYLDDLDAESADSRHFRSDVVGPGSPRTATIREAPRQGEVAVRVVEAGLCDAARQATSLVGTGEALQFRFRIVAAEAIGELTARLRIFDEQGACVAASASVGGLDHLARPSERRLDLAAGESVLVFDAPANELGRGRYRAGLVLERSADGSVAALPIEGDLLAFAVSREGPIQTVHYEPRSEWTALQRAQAPGEDGVSKVVPVNYRRQDTAREAIERDVAYTFQITEFYRSRIPGGDAALIDRSVLEIGPGYSLGTAVLLACHGARVTVADRYLASWDQAYHPLFFRELLEQLGRRGRDLDPDPIRTLLGRGDFVPEVLACLHEGLEDLAQTPDDAFDIVLSNAVFEHIRDVPGAVRTLHRITRGGGLGIHQVDFRDHRDFDRPLEFLTLDSNAFEAMFDERSGECGNRWRHTALADALRTTGFEIAEFDANMHAADDYLDEVIPRLHPEYHALDRATLGVISGCFHVRKPRAINTEYPVENDHPQTLAHSRARYAFAAPIVRGGRVLDLGCGAGLGTRMLGEAGATGVIGVDIRSDALALAEAQGDERTRFQQGDIEQPLPFDDESFDGVVALEVLEHVGNQHGLVKEVHRILDPAGVAVISVPDKSFEQMWTRLAGEGNPYHVHVPDAEEFVGLLDAFDWVEFHAQVDVVSTLVLPLEGRPDATQRASLHVPGQAELTDAGVVTLLAVCRKRRPVPGETSQPVAYSYGNYQRTFGSAMESNQNLTADLQRSRHEGFAARNRLKWESEPPSETE